MTSTLPSLIGNTPLVRLNGVGAPVAPVEVYAKAEWFNPSGSVKDRAAWNIMRTAIADGRLTRDKALLDATSGNMGIAYAMLGAALGYRVTLIMPANVSPERKVIIGAYGAEVVYTDPLSGSDGAIERARELFAATPGAFFYANQYDNDANWQAHYHGTAEEIWRQTGGRVTHFVTGLGTSGTFIGTARRLRELNPLIRLISLQPDSPLNAIEGWKHMPTAITPGIYDAGVADEDRGVDSDEAHAMARRLAREDGLFVSPSAGAAAAGALQVAAELCARGERSVIVTVFADAGYKYISDQIPKPEFEI